MYLSISPSKDFLGNLMARKFTMSLPESMYKALEEERKRRRLDNIQETIRSILAEYFKGSSKNH